MATSTSHASTCAFQDGCFFLFFSKMSSCMHVLNLQSNSDKNTVSIGEGCWALCGGYIHSRVGGMRRAVRLQYVTEALCHNSMKTRKKGHTSTIYYSWNTKTFYMLMVLNGDYLCIVWTSFSA